MFSVFALALWWWFKCWRGWPVNHWLISQAPANGSVRMCLFRRMLRLVQVWKLVLLGVVERQNTPHYPILFYSLHVMKL